MGSGERLLDDGLVRILHVEDNLSDAVLTQEQLRTVRPAVSFHHVTRLGEMRDSADGPFDCILLDLSLPDGFGVDIIDWVREAHPGVPVLVLTGHDDVATGVEAVRRGAQDYLVKNRADPLSLDRAIRYALERQRLERLLAQQALHDALTGLPNRALFRDRLSQAVERTRRHGGVFALLMLDLDHFKNVNDTLGHAAGDALLIQAASRLRSALRPTDTLCRLGGDEFTVLCEDFRDPEDVSRLAERIIAQLGPPFDLGSQTVHAGVSIGVALSGEGCTPEGLLRDADTALYAAKNAGRGRVAWFSADLHIAAETRFSLENALRQALQTGMGFTVAYQPIVDTASGSVRSLEALARWTHPTRGPVPPAQFIPLAESAGIMPALDIFVVEQALHELARRRRTDPTLGININVSGQTLGTKSFEDDLPALARRYGVPAEAITLEVLESALLSHGAAEAAGRLRQSGFRIALDDFGAGVSSLTHFVTMTADVVKIDRSFVAAAAAGNARAVTLLRLMISAGAELGMAVVAEGVEGQSHLEICRNLGVTEAQGYLWGRV